MKLISLLKETLTQARQDKAYWVSQDTDPPAHVRNRNMALCVTHLEDALLRAMLALRVNGLDLEE